jgi:hypothetical protein
MHPGLPPNFSFGRLDPLLRPTSHRLATQKPHLLHQPLLRGVRLLEVSLRVLDRADNRSQSVAKGRMRLKKRQQRLVTELHRRHGSILPSFTESPAYPAQR